jgi:hypothetical protein
MDKHIHIIILVLFATMPVLAQQCSHLTDIQTPPRKHNAECATQLPYRPLSTHDKFMIFVHRTYSPYTFASTAFDATWAQMTGQWYEYGGGMQGYGKRFGATLADSESRTLIQTFALSSLLHQDPRYFPSRRAGLVPRAWYAGTRVLITRSDEGKPTFNTSGLIGTVSVSALENAYYPEHDRGFSDTMIRFVGAMGSDATTNLLREFWPDIRRIFRKHEPNQIRKIEEKLPVPKTTEQKQ